VLSGSFQIVCSGGEGIYTKLLLPPTESIKAEGTHFALPETTIPAPRGITIIYATSIDDKRSSAKQGVTDIPKRTDKRADKDT